MAVELATAYIALVPSLKGASKKISDELNPASEAAGTEAGSKMGHGMLGSMKGIIGAGMAIAASGMFAGFIKDAAAASDATDKFKATMSFAGMDTSAITAASKAAKDYADQTVYDLPTIQNMTAQLASNGVKDYTGLTQAAGNLNAVAGGNAETFKSVAMVMTQTAGAGKLTTENWNQLSDAIPGAAGPLMRAMQDAGAYTGNFRDAMAAGQITSDEFNAALQKLGTDPVAVEAARSTKTFEGAIGNLQATINSGLMGALNALKPAITGAINGLSSGLGAIFGAFSAIFELFKTGDFNGGIGKALGIEEDSPIIGVILGIRQAFSDLWAGLTMPPDVAASIGAPLGGLVAFGAKARSVLDEVSGGFRAFGAAWQANNGDVTSNGFAGMMERIANGLREGIGGVRAFFAAFAAGGDDITSSGFAGQLEGLGLQARRMFDGVGPVLSQVFGTLASTIGPLIPQLVSVWTAFSPLQIIFRAIEPMLPQIVSVFTQLASVLGSTLTSALSAIIPMSAVLSQTLGSVLAAVLPVVVQVVTMLGEALSRLLPVVVPIITTVVTLAGTLISQLAPIVMQLVAGVLPPLISIFENIVGAIGPLLSIIQFLMPIVVTVFGVVVNVIVAAMQIVQGIIQVVTGIISGNWSQVWSGILNIFSGIWNTIIAVVSGVFSILWSVISSGLSAVFGFVGSILGSIGRFFADTWNNVISGVGGFIGQLLGFFNDLPGKIMGALAGAGSWLFNIGKDIINGLIDGVQSMMGAIGNAILSLIPGPIVGVFKDALGIHSPSRVFRALGKHIPEGLNLGIDDGADDVASTMRNLVTVPDLPALGAPSASIAAAGRGATGATFNTTINQVDDPIGTAHAVTRRQLALSS